MLTLALVLLYICNTLASNLDGRIVGGTETTIEKYPWQLSLMFYGRHICGAAILSTEWAISTARCVGNYNIKTLHLRAGSNSHANGGTIHSLKSVDIHDSFLPNSDDYDIALIMVENPFDFESEIVSAVKLPSAGASPPVGSITHVTGWGNTKENGLISDRLQVVELPVISTAKCRELYSPKNITMRMFCAGYEKGGIGICTGDFGGPLVIRDTLYGLASWSKGCAEQKYPGIFVHIGALRYWIKHISDI